MSGAKKRAPKRRFKEFLNAGDWEQRKFLDLLDAQYGIRRGPFGSSLKKDSFVKKSDYVVYEQQNAIYDNYETRYFISKEKYNELIRFNIQPGDFIMSGAGTIGRISMVPDGIKKGVFNQALIRFKVNKDSINPLYFLKFMQSDMMQKQLTQANPGSAMTNLVPMDELKKWDVTIPSLEEQNKISTFINQIDEFITLHQRKLDKLQATKKALLQEMFPEEGQDKPKRRFKGFTDAWEQCKLRNLLEQPITDGPHETPELYVSGIPFISVDAIVDNKIDFTKMRGYISKEYDDICAKKYKPQINDVYLVKSGATIGKVAIVDTYDDFNIWSPLAAMRCGSITNPYFLYILLQTQDLQSQVFNKASHGTQPNLSMRQLEKFTCKVPKIEEQKLISRFLKQLSDVITLHQHKLDKLKNLKQAYLNEMFV